MPRHDIMICIYGRKRKVFVIPGCDIRGICLTGQTGVTRITPILEKAVMRTGEFSVDKVSF